MKKRWINNLLSLYFIVSCDDSPNQSFEWDWFSAGAPNQPITRALYAFNGNIMDRAEAYKLLILEIEKASSNSQSFLESIASVPLEVEAFSDTGKRYSISLTSEKTGSSSYEVKGNIHDNNSHKFELLEEQIEVNK